MPSNVVDDHDVVALGVTRRGPFTKATETDDSQHKMKLLYNSMFAVIEIVVMSNVQMRKIMFTAHASEGIRNVRETDATMIARTNT
jgi:hypothetical protein